MTLADAILYPVIWLLFCHYAIIIISLYFTIAITTHYHDIDYLFIIIIAIIIIIIIITPCHYFRLLLLLLPLLLHCLLLYYYYY